MLDAKLISGHYFIPPVEQAAWEELVEKIETPPPPPTPPQPAASPLPQLPSGQLTLVRPGDWPVVQQAATGRIRTIDNFYTSANQPFDKVLQFEVRPGEVTDTGGYLASRSEVALKVDMTVGEFYWYDFSISLPSDFALEPSTNWITNTQWKGQRGSSPPLALEIRKGHWWVGGTLGPKVTGADLGPVDINKWTRFRFGIKWGTTVSSGSIEVHRDGNIKVAKQPAVTLEIVDGTPDLIYLKQGIYRTKAWTVKHTASITPIAIIKA